MISSTPNLRLTLDAIDEALFYRRPFTPAEREELTLQILSRQIQTGPRAGMFSHGTAERESSPRLFSGERLHTLLAAHQTLLIDSARILILLEGKTGAVTRAIELAPDSAQAQASHALTMSISGDDQAAERGFEAAIHPAAGRISIQF